MYSFALPKPHALPYSSISPWYVKFLLSNNSYFLPSRNVKLISTYPISNSLYVSVLLPKSANIHGHTKSNSLASHLYTISTLPWTVISPIICLVFLEYGCRDRDNSFWGVAFYFSPSRLFLCLSILSMIAILLLDIS